MMSRNRFVSAASLVFVLSSVFAVGRQARAQDAKTRYPGVASLEHYRMADRTEIAPARSTAPTSIARYAGDPVFDQMDYQTAVEAKDGFTCIAEQAWGLSLDSPKFWNPRIRGPIVYEPVAERTILPYRTNRTTWAFSGSTKMQTPKYVTAAFVKNKLPILGDGATLYRFSKAGNLGDSLGHRCPHLMFHVPKTEKGIWGADLADPPVSYQDENRDVPEPETIFMAPVSQWPDGTEGLRRSFD